MKTCVLTLLVASIFGVDSQLNCSDYESDKFIIESYENLILINPPVDSQNVSFAIVDNNGYVVNLTLINETAILNGFFCLSQLETLVLENCAFTQIDPSISNLGHSLVSLRINRSFGFVEQQIDVVTKKYSKSSSFRLSQYQQ